MGRGSGSEYEGVGVYRGSGSESGEYLREYQSESESGKLSDSDVAASASPSEHSRAHNSHLCLGNDQSNGLVMVATQRMQQTPQTTRIETLSRAHRTRPNSSCTVSHIGTWRPNRKFASLSVASFCKTTSGGDASRFTPATQLVRPVAVRTKFSATSGTTRQSQIGRFGTAGARIIDRNRVVCVDAAGYT